ncbi:PAS domain S-box protein [Roseicella aquatilis]|uniref:histidine kinase n=1 Tax=Roseicella aquatilis TaxID=2527868 RepID=A0A4R4DVD8_9PROT|nr:PAS domain S-box protein [Roseicella aquatilis]TCZ64410.1 PAS domain S-box protein [Roseicella aquatilis]
MPDTLLDHQTWPPDDGLTPLPREAGGPRRFGLRLHLAAILLAALLPALAAGSLAVWSTAKGYREAYEARLRDAARALSLAIDADVWGRIEALNAFASSPAFGDGIQVADIASVHLHAGRVAAATGMRIGVGDAEGRFVLHDQVPPGVPLPDTGMATAVLRDAVLRNRAIVSDVMTGPVTRRPVVAIVVPVPRTDGGSPSLSANGSINPEHYDRLLARQGLGNDVSAGLVDASGAVLARPDGRFRGMELPTGLWTALRSAPAGLLRQRGIDGQERLVAFARLPTVSGWTVTVSTPYATYRASWAWPLLGMLGGILAALALAGGLVMLLARRILRPLRGLAGHARAVALDPGRPRGSAADLPPSSVAELEALRRGLAAAEAALHQRTEAERAAYAALAEKEAMLATAQQLTSLGSWTLDLDEDGDPAAGLLRWTDETYRIFGHAPGSVALSVALFNAAVPPEDRPRIRAELAEAIARRRPYRIEHRIIRPDGTVRLVEELAAPELDGRGRVRRIVGCCQDVTERRMAEAALADNAERLRELLSTLDLAAFMARDGDGTIRFWSAGCERLYGWSAAEALGRNAHDLLGTAFPTPAAEIDAALARDGEWMGELRQRRRDGEPLMVLVRKALRRDVRGRPVAVVESLADVTALREAREALAESEARLRLALEGAGLGLWELDLPRNRLRLDALAASIGGGLLPADAWIADDGPEFDAWLAAVHPEDRARREASHARMIAGDEGLMEFEFRLRVGDAWRWLAFRATVLSRRADGRAARVISVVRDTTEAREAEAAIRDSEAMLRRVLDNLFAFVGVLAPDGTLLDANRAPLEAAGITLEEVRGQPFWDAHWWSHDAGVAGQVREACRRAAAGEASRFDLDLRMAGDDRMAVDFQVAPLRDAAGRITHLIPSSVDITERKRSEEAKMLLAREVDHRAKNALAVVQSVLTLTRTEDPATFKKAVIGRIAAMALAHTLLARERWNGADLQALLEEEMAAYRGGGGPDSPVRLDGPPVGLAPDAAQPVAMAIHELATNAAKYGALSLPGGQVHIGWSRDPEGGGLCLAWRERGGPPVAAPPARPGFGTSLIRSTVVRQLQGRLEMLWEAAGLRCAMVLPARQVRWLSRAAPCLDTTGRKD